jgi:hypothetical protein
MTPELEVYMFRDEEGNSLSRLHSVGCTKQEDVPGGKIILLWPSSM